MCRLPGGKSQDKFHRIGKRVGTYNCGRDEVANGQRDGVETDDPAAGGGWRKLGHICWDGTVKHTDGNTRNDASCIISSAHFSKCTYMERHTTDEHPDSDRPGLNGSSDQRNQTVYHISAATATCFLRSRELTFRRE
jgi:hypothetical protein